MEDMIFKQRQQREVNILYFLTVYFDHGNAYLIIVCLVSARVSKTRKGEESQTQHCMYTIIVI